MTRRRRIFLWTLAAILALTVIATIAGILTLRSAWFHEQVRARMVREIEKASGGKTEIGSFRLRLEHHARRR